MSQFLTKLPIVVAVVVYHLFFSKFPTTLGLNVNNNNASSTQILKALITGSSSRNYPSFEKPFPSLTGLSESCSRDVDRLITQVQAIIGDTEGDSETPIENWALQMLDAFGKVPEGILSGHVNSLGDFDECLAVRAPVEGQTWQPFQGKYCVVYIVPNLPAGPGPVASETSELLASSDPRTVENLLRILSITAVAELPIIPSIGSCLPSTCSDQEVVLIMRELLVNTSLTPVTSFCSIDEPTKFGAGAIATISILGIFIACIACGTIADLGVKYNYLSLSFSRTTFYRVLLAFSIASNGKKLFNTKTSPNDIGCLHGIRFLSASWVVLGHTYMLGIMQPQWNIVETYEMITSDPSILVIVNAPIVVDVFFVLGGFLVSLTLLAMITKTKGRLNILLLYLHRYLRITPLYMILICVGTFLVPLMGSGPYWFIAKTWAGFCEKNWWKNMLYINNLPIYDTLNDPQDAPCYGIAWYLGVDMQMFLLSPFLLYPVWRWRKYGQIPLVVLTLVSIILPGLLTYINNWLPTTVPIRNEEDKFSQLAYTPTYMRATPYLIGMCAGLIYNSIRDKAFQFQLKKVYVIIAWLLAFAVGFAVLFSPQKFYDPDYNFKRGESGIYVSGVRTGWSLAISWLIFACATGYGGWINQFLSWRPFVPLGRLTFAIYLVSLHLQFLFHLQYRQPIYLENYHMVNLFFAHLVMSCIVAVIATLVIEAPLMQLLNIVLPTKRQKRTNEGNNQNATREIDRAGESQEGSLDPGTSSHLATSQDKLV